MITSMAVPDCRGNLTMFLSSRMDSALLRRHFPGESQAAARLRQMDWITDELGTPDTWPQSLQAAIRVCVASRSPMQVLLGTSRAVICNDASMRVLGERLEPEPRVLAHSGRDAFGEDLWDVIGPTVDHVFVAGVTSWCENVRVLARHGASEDETFVTFWFAPISDDSGAVVGVLGSCVDVTESVVAARSLIDPQAKACDTPSAAQGNAHAARRRLLLVEDDDDAARALKNALEARGYVVQLAHDGPVALNVARTFDPDVVLMDIGLPVMDGWELAKRLRALPGPANEVPVVAVTALARDDDKQRSVDAGFIDHLVKPIDLAKLQQVVENLPLREQA
jgi:CheY-like chemotaxis protein